MTEEEIRNETNEDLKVYKRWIDGNCLAINAQKSKFMIFKMKNKAEINPTIKIGGEYIEKVSSIKYLGITLDDKLTWKNHVDSVIKKIIPVVAAVGRATKTNISTAKIIYNAHILSHVRYLVAIWAQASKSNMQRIQRTLTRSLKILNRIPLLTASTEVLRKTRCLSLSEIVFLEKVKLIYKIENNEIKTNAFLTHNKDIHNYGLRNVNDIRTMRARTEKLNSTTMITASKLYNTLPDWVKNATSIYVFTRRAIKYVKMNRLSQDRN